MTYDDGLLIGYGLGLVAGAVVTYAAASVRRNAELVAAAEQALDWIRGVRQAGDGWNDGTAERLEAALRGRKQK